MNAETANSAQQSERGIASTLGNGRDVITTGAAGTPGAG